MRERRRGKLDVDSLSYVHGGEMPQAMTSLHPRAARMAPVATIQCGGARSAARCSGCSNAPRVMGVLFWLGLRVEPQVVHAGIGDASPSRRDSQAISAPLYGDR